MDERRFVDAHGVEVFSRWWPVEHPRGIVVIAHGASEHSGRYGRFAEALNGAGLAAVAIDHRGHGLTATTETAVMGPGGGRSVLDDLHQLRVDASASFSEDVPVFVFGHSMGSLIALAYLAHHSDGLSGAILCGVAVNVEDTATLASLLQGFDAPERRDHPAVDLLGSNNAVFEPARTKFDWLSRDPDEVDRYLADPLCGDSHPLTYGYLIDLFDVVAPAGERLGSIACPVLVIAGDQDPAAAMGAHALTLGTALGTAGVTDVDVCLYKGARHELLNETNRDEVTADIIGWLDSRS